MADDLADAALDLYGEPTIYDDSEIDKKEFVDKVADLMKKSGYDKVLKKLAEE